jgi:hypothetical protein
LDKEIKAKSMLQSRLAILDTEIAGSATTLASPDSCGVMHRCSPLGAEAATCRKQLFPTVCVCITRELSACFCWCSPPPLFDSKHSNRHDGCAVKWLGASHFTASKQQLPPPTDARNADVIPHHQNIFCALLLLLFDAVCQ